MNFLFYFRLSSYLLVGSGFLALLVTEYYGIFSALLFAGLLVLGWRVDVGKLRFPRAHLFWNLFTLAALVLCLMDAIFLRRLTSVALVNFLIFLQFTKLAQPKRHRDYTIIYIISFFELLISSIMTFSLLFAFSCLVFAISGTWALITLQLKRDIDTHVLPPTTALEPHDAEAAFNRPGLNSLLSKKFFVSTSGITVLAAVLSLVIFVILPRIRGGEGVFRYQTPFSQPVSGFTEEVALDTFGAIRLDHTPVMRVEFPQIADSNHLPSQLYWKGMSYSYYDGIRWRTENPASMLLPAPSNELERIWLVQPRTTRSLLEQRIELTTPHYETLFAVNKAYGLQGRFLSLQYDQITENSQVIFPPAAPTYTVFSEVVTPSAEALRLDHAAYPEHIRALYLQTPTLSDQLTNLAQTLTQGRQNAYTLAKNVQGYLSRNYTYSLNVQRTADHPPLDDFLFINKAGHCEYYATSMAILLRIQGVPTRVVNGFARGRWNEFGRFFTVRQSDAHAWVEVYFPSYGWITFDPTPPAAFGETYQEFVETQQTLALAYRYYEYIRTRWNRYVLDYSTNDQARLVVSTFRATHAARRRVSWSIQRARRVLTRLFAQASPRQYGMIAGILLAGGLGLLLLLRLLKGTWFRRILKTSGPSSTKTSMIDFYQAMLSALARHGIRKHAATTPGEFARHVLLHYPRYADDVRLITDWYYAVRYGQKHVQDAERSHLEEKLNRLRQPSHPEEK